MVSCGSPRPQHGRVADEAVGRAQPPRAAPGGSSVAAAGPCAGRALPPPSLARVRRNPSGAGPPGRGGPHTGTGAAGRGQSHARPPQGRRRSTTPHHHGSRRGARRGGLRVLGRRGRRHRRARSSPGNTPHHHRRRRRSHPDRHPGSGVAPPTGGRAGRGQRVHPLDPPGRSPGRDRDLRRGHRNARNHPASPHAHPLGGGPLPLDRTTRPGRTRGRSGPPHLLTDRRRR